MRIAFPPYDFLILASTTFLLGIFIKRAVFKTHSYQKGTDKLFPYAFAYILVSVAFIYIFEEFPVKFFLHDDYYKIDDSQMSPQGMQIDNKRLFALVYNFIIWIFCLIIIIRHFLIRKKWLAKN